MSARGATLSLPERSIFDLLRTLSTVSRRRRLQLVGPFRAHAASAAVAEPGDAGAVNPVTLVDGRS